MNDMESIQTRRNTFITGARVKTGKKTTVFRWPHPAHYGANPDTLADAGFYFTPSPDDRDCVRCFACGKELSEWDSDDNPHAIHYQKCGSTCPWAIVRCGLEMERDKRGRYKFADADRIPNSEHMENARLATFSDQWPHDDVKGHGASSEKMAQAGFSYTPTPESKDTVTCHYCLTTFNNWGPSDHPLEDHRKSAQAKDCPFLAHLPSVKSSRASSRPPARGRKSVRASSRAPSTSESAAESEVDLGRSTLGRSTRKRQKVSTSDVEAPAKKSVKKPLKSTKAATAEVQEPTPPSSKMESADAPTYLGRSTRGRSRAESVEEESIAASTKPVRKGAKSKANARNASVAPSETDRTDSESGRAALGRSTRQRSKAVVKEEEELSAVTPKPKRRTGRSIAPAPEAEEAEPPKRRRTRASSVARSVVDESDEDMEIVTAAPPKRGRSAKKSVVPAAPAPKAGKKATTRQASVAPDVSEEEEAVSAPKAKARTRGKSVGKAAPVEEPVEPDPPAKRTRTGKSTRGRSQSVAQSTEDEGPAVVTKPAARLGKSTSKRSVVEAEAGQEPAPKPVTSRKSVRDRSQPVVPTPAEELEEAEPVTTGKKQKTAASRTAKSQKHIPELASETEEQVHAAPLRRVPSTARSKPPSEDVEMAPPKKVTNKPRGTSRQTSSALIDEQTAARPPRILNRSRSKPPTPEQSDSEQVRPMRRTRAKSRGPSPAPSESNDNPPMNKTQRRGRSRGPSVIPDADDGVATPLPPAKDRKPSRMRSLSQVRPPLESQSFDHAKEVDELNPTEAESEPESPSPEKPRRSKPASLGRPAVLPADTKGKGKAKIPATPAAKPPPPHQHTARKLQSTFQVVKAHEDSDMDSDAKSPQPMTPAPAKVRLTTPESALTEDESFQRASSPSPVKPRHSRQRPHDVDDVGDYSMFDGEAHESLRDESLRDEPTVVLAHPVSKGTPSVRRSSAASRPLVNQAVRLSRAASPDTEDEADESVIDIRSDEETRAFKLQPRPQAGPSQVKSKPSTSILKTSKPPSTSSRNPPSKLPAQVDTTIDGTTKPPKLPTKQEAARAQEASKAQVQALRARFTSPAPGTAPPAKASANPSADTNRNASTRAANGNVEAPSKALGQGQVPQPPSAALPPWMTTPHAFPTSLTEEERAMTVEEWIRKQAMNERDRFKRDAEEYIRAFEEKAAETRATIETRIGA